MSPNEEKEEWYYLVVKTLSALFSARIVFILLEQKINWNLMQKYVKPIIFLWNCTSIRKG